MAAHAGERAGGEFGGGPAGAGFAAARVSRDVLHRRQRDFEDSPAPGAVVGDGRATRRGAGL